METARSVIQEDFDTIASLGCEGWGHNSHYHDFLLRYVPIGCDRALDIGCGSGAFTRLLADRANHVLGLDLSPGMVDSARERSGDYSNIDYEVADVTAWEFPVMAFDCITSIATMHHLPMHEILTKCGRALRPNGILLVLDLYQWESILEYLSDVLAVPVSLGFKLLKTGHSRKPDAVREAWARHGPHDEYLTLRELREICDDVLPGARVRWCLLWRYSLVFQKHALQSAC